MGKKGIEEAERGEGREGGVMALEGWIPLGRERGKKERGGPPNV